MIKRFLINSARNPIMSIVVSVVFVVLFVYTINTVMVEKRIEVTCKVLKYDSVNHILVVRAEDLGQPGEKVYIKYTNSNVLSIGHIKSEKVSSDQLLYEIVSYQLNDDNSHIGSILKVDGKESVRERIF